MPETPEEIEVYASALKKILPTAQSERERWIIREEIKRVVNEKLNNKNS